jgi:hypothetical protein
MTSKRYRVADATTILNSYRTKREAMGFLAALRTASPDVAATMAVERLTSEGWVPA